MAWDVLILGGGFGGLTTARRLERILPRNSARITLVNDVNFMLYTPLLPGAAGGTLEPRHVVVPLREELKRTRLVLGQVRSADLDAGHVDIVTAAGAEERLRYDQLVVTLGAVARSLPIPGLEEHSRGFKTLPEAIALRNRLLQNLEKSETVEGDDAAREALLTVVFVGGGYAGVEGLAEIQDLAADVVDLYPRSRLHGLRFVLIEARDRIMGEIPPDLSDFAAAYKQTAATEIYTNTTVERLSADSVEISTGEIIPTRTVVWTAGVRPHPTVNELGLPLDDSGRIRVDSRCKGDGRENVWALGDAAAVPDPARPGHPCPPTCQHAIRQAKVVAANVANAIGTGSGNKTFTYKTKGVFVDMGRYEAVASTVGIKWRGFPAWFFARTYHLAMMPGNKRRTRLMLDWTVSLLFGRDSSELGQVWTGDRGLQAHSSGGSGASPVAEGPGEARPVT